MFSSLLVANRGEIARRIFRTARAMGLRTIAVYSDADSHARFVAEADHAIRIGPAPARESYLDRAAILAAAKEAGAQAIHPGYGFLSENPDFAQDVAEAGLIWVGPRAATIRALGLKDEAKAIAEKAGVPVVPGFRGADQRPATLLKAAEKIGFPVLIKAVAGGGGRGIREVAHSADFLEALASARREAASAFGDDRVLIEKLIARPRHVEVQILGDRAGKVLHFFERDCSLQRRRQKVIEEAPAPGLSAPLRAALADAAVALARAAGYENAGTVEFILGAGRGVEDFYFLEMNTRLQVEHPVTEAITGVDLVEWQLRVAAGEPLGLEQADLAPRGWAIEARLCAEDPAHDFRPRIGRITRFDLAPAAAAMGEASLRLDSGFEVGDDVPGAYDSLIAKLIVHSHEGREAARRAAIAALDGLALAGIGSNGGFLRNCLALPEFAEGAVHTGLIAEHGTDLTARSTKVEPAAAAAALAHWRAAAPAEAGFRLNGPARALWRGVLAEDEARPAISVIVEDGAAVINGAVVRAPAAARVFLDPLGHQAGAEVHLGGEAFVFVPSGAVVDLDHKLAGDVVLAPMPGKVAAIRIEAGARVSKGQTLILFEAMKMELPLSAPRDGVVAALDVAQGAQVKEGEVLVRLAEED